MLTFCVIFALLIILLAVSTTIRQPQREGLAKRLRNTCNTRRTAHPFGALFFI
ncbi:hypothetical protein GZB58_002206 [Salmonella enterica]|nr:hypothetical protein [Salmonella enterica subsp. enterica serovar Havana]EDZ5623850.1 hypothetical protein [Salmonella enterica]EDQ2366669.1 hypothetical protein [Salmonella enterica subsp. enterica serovar Havana]EDQ7931109.1 hypothetical protein [Salmonella enterica subsp. enterica serovar Havana]EDR6957890.1 hypothetical protein [Salmonella enterica subsp. enterica serovar Havana]